MRFLVDENLPPDIVSTATDHDHQATWVRDVLPGATDAAILARLRATRETLVTRDVRFANLVVALSISDSSLGGVVLIREQRLAAIRKAWLRLLRSPRAMAGITVLTADRVRFRRRSP